MKLRSIALAGLLGAGMLMTSGCTEDDIKDAIASVIKPSVIIAINATDASQDMKVEGIVDASKLTIPSGESQLYIPVGENSYSISYGTNIAEKTFSKNTGNMYGMCNTTGAVVTAESNTADKLAIANLTSGKITDVNITLGLDTTGDDQTDSYITEIVTVNACAKLSVFGNLDTSEVNEAIINGESSGVKGDLTDDPDLQKSIDKLGGTAKFVLAITKYDAITPANTKGVIVPLVPAVDAL